MERIEKLKDSHFHQLYSEKCVRFKYDKTDWCDYVLMCLFSSAVIGFCFGFLHHFTIFCSIMSLIMIYMFKVRHGVALKMPLLLRRPVDLIFIFIYKIKNLKVTYFFAVFLLVVENVLIFLTPTLPHYVDEMRVVGYFLFWLHFVIITLYRTRILVDHLLKTHIIRDVLMKTVWRSMLKKEENIKVHVWHAYFTGILSHALLIAPWYLVITYSNFSVLLIIPMVFINYKMNIHFMKLINEWFYRDHWVGHHSELDFVYLHGPHHDAIPSGLIGVGGNGFLEGFFRHAIGVPTSLFNPFAALFFNTFEVYQDIITHQYIPGIFPQLPKNFNQIAQHSIHHFGRLQPYGFALNLKQDGLSDKFRASFKGLPDEFINSYRLDEQLNGFEWDNPKHKWFLDIVDKYNTK